MIGKCNVYKVHIQTCAFISVWIEDKFSVKYSVKEVDNLLHVCYIYS